MKQRSRQWEIYCSVVDNFGDIGVTWRLARQLVNEWGQQVRLRVDDLHSFARLCPTLDPSLSTQWQEGVEICHRPTDEDKWSEADILIEAFACELPAGLRQQLSQSATTPLWINLEYLSAESWIDGCHGLPSLQSNGLNKFFYFPGFTPTSGGLICEQELAAKRRAWQADPRHRQKWLTLPDGRLLPSETRLYSLFTYESDALPDLLQYWSEQSQPICCLIPEGRILSSLGNWCSMEMKAGGLWQQGSLTIRILPMTDQEGYDRLLWSCDFNFVRGEDSFLRAQWAARPFLWHIYPQQDAAHLEKLDAFLERYLANLSPEIRNALAALHHSYTSGQGQACVLAWQQLERECDELTRHASNWPETALAGGDLTSRLVQFCEKQLECRVYSKSLFNSRK